MKGTQQTKKRIPSRKLSCLLEILIMVIVCLAIWFAYELINPNWYKVELEKELPVSVIKTIPGQNYKEKYVEFQLNKSKYKDEGNHHSIKR